MPEIAWDIKRVEAQAKKWQEMASVLANDHDRVAWLIEQISYLSASHMQLQQGRFPAELIRRVKRGDSHVIRLKGPAAIKAAEQILIGEEL